MSTVSELLVEKLRLDITHIRKQAPETESRRLKIVLSSNVIAKSNKVSWI